ncbi:hypothetical protein NUSPORA_01676 [Nucleospora cyclopteri]
MILYCIKNTTICHFYIFNITKIFLYILVLNTNKVFEISFFNPKKHVSYINV